MTIEEQYNQFGITEEMRQKFSYMENEFSQINNSIIVINKTVVLAPNKITKTIGGKKNA